MHRPPHIEPGEKIVLFDGICSLCSAWTGFVIKHDKRRALKLCSIQSPEGRAILAWAGLPMEDVNTMVYVQNDMPVTQSDAFFGVLRELDRPWSFLSALQIFPRALRDVVYRFLAKHRYRLFGKRDECFLPTPETRARFIDQYHS